MAGILHFLGLDGGQGGVLSSGSPAPIPSAPQVGKLGLFGAALQDAGAYLQQRPGDANNLDALQKLSAQQNLLAALNSPDPKVRAQAYGVAPGYGIDPKAFQQQAAQKAMPDLLNAMGNGAPVQSTAPVAMPTGLPQLPGALPFNDPSRQAAKNAYAGPGGLNLSDALAQAGNPEARAQFALPLIQQQMALAAKKVTPLSAQEAHDAGLRDGGLYGHDAAGNIVTIQASDLKSQAAVDQQHQIELNKPNPNQPFNNDGTPNKAYQEWELRKEKASGAGSSMAGWQLLVDPKSNVPYRYNVRTGQALDFSGQPYTPQGASHVASGQVRSAASLAAQRFVQEHPNATAADIAQFSADFGATGKSVGAFSTGKQGDLIRSFNVGIAHLNTLDGLVGALGNGNIQAFNKLGNAYAQQTGNPAPANFDAAKAIVGDEIIKAIVGGGGALADRENAQNQINRANSPQQLAGVIKTYKTLMAGQLEGLKKQYADTTHRNNFDSRLSPEAQSELEAPHRGPSTLPPNPASLPRKPSGKTIRFEDLP